MDGTTGAIQDRIRQQHKANAHSMMYYMNLFSSLYLLIGLLITGELFDFVVFVQSYPKVIIELFTLAAASALGQVPVFKLQFFFFSFYFNSYKFGFCSFKRLPLFSITFIISYNYLPIVVIIFSSSFSKP